jgi:hypothetical protein
MVFNERLRMCGRSRLRVHSSADAAGGTDANREAIRIEYGICVHVLHREDGYVVVLMSLFEKTVCAMVTIDVG